MASNSRSVISPKRKQSRKSKRRADGDTVHGVVAQVQKRSRNTISHSGQPEDGSEPRRSARSGAGSGGRIDQLEKLGTVLEAPIRFAKKTNDIPEGTLDNPCAPEKFRKGHTKQPPPSYVSKLPVSTPSAPSPVFHQRASDSQRFGFVAPPAMPDPQQYQPSSHPPSRQPSVLHGLDQRLSHPQYGRPVVKDSQIDPALLSNHQLPSGPSASQNYGVTHGSDASTESSDDEGSDGSDESHDNGWGTTNRRELTHPGFSQELPTNSPPRHVPLPEEFTFDHSRDEEEDAALRVLGQPDGEDSLLATHGDVADVLDFHHQTNGRPSAPCPDRLAAVSSSAANQVQPNNSRVRPSAVRSGQTISSNETNQGQSIVAEIKTRAPRNSKKSKNDPISPDTLGYYPPVWKDLLEDAKRDCRIAHVLKNPFPSKSRDLKTSITECLVATVVEWTQNNANLEPDYWPEQQVNMASLLLADISTWRSELKTVAVNVAPSAYGLVAPSDTEDRMQWVKSRATSLLQQSLFLRDGSDENGKTKNFAHPALKQVLIDFFYVGSYRIADKRPDLFRSSIPVSCLALVAAAHNCILDGFAQSGSGRSIPQFSGKSYSSIYRGLLSMVDQVLKNTYHGPRLQEQLSQWGREGWASLQEIDNHVERHDHLSIVLD